MQQRVWDKSRLPSRHVTEGPGARAAPQPITTPWAWTRPRSPSLSSASRRAGTRPRRATSRSCARRTSVKPGVKAAGGTPREFTTITVTDGIAMGHQGMKSSLVSREVIADSVELTMRGHSYDALVGCRRLRQERCPA